MTCPQLNPLKMFDSFERQQKFSLIGNNNNQSDLFSFSSNNSKNNEKTYNHTVFLFNLLYSISENDVKEFIRKYGEIKNIFLNLEKGQAYITYYDFRSSLKLIEESRFQSLGGRRIGARFANKKINK